MTGDLAGKKVRWTYDDGPVKGKVFEHRFGGDGMVSYHEVKDGQASDIGGEKAVKYEVAPVSDDVYAVSYLASTGWTLTTVVDEKSKRIVSFASNEKQLVPQRGRLL